VSSLDSSALTVCAGVLMRLAASSVILWRPRHVPMLPSRALWLGHASCQYSPLPLELDARGLIHSCGWCGLARGWCWRVWGFVRYVIDSVFASLIVFIVSPRQSTMRQRASSLPLDRRVSTRRRPLRLVLHILSCHSTCPVDLCACVSARSASVRFDSGSAVWVDMHVLRGSCCMR
jgi:hypothetical protein